MWLKEYKDYPPDKPLIKEKVVPGQINGCEMHEVNGWGQSYHRSPPRKRGLFYHWLVKIFGGEEG